MKKILYATVFVTGAFTAVHAEAANVAISCGAVGAEFQFCKDGVDAWAEETGHTVQVVSTPNESDARLALYQQLLSAQSPDIDVFQIDIVWPGTLASHMVDLNEYIDKETIDSHFSTIIENNTVGGKLVGMPWFTDAGLLYYRQDLLDKYGKPVPTTWEELTQTAQEIQDAERQAGNRDMWGFVWQGKAYEGLTCDALEWVDSFGGGTVVSDSGEITINNPEAIRALDLAASWVGTITPNGVLNYAEEDARGVFQSGRAVFMRNWPYAWGLANSEDSPIRGMVGIAALPKGGQGGKNTGTLGGWQLAVSRYSDNPEVAADLVRYLTSREEQKRRAIEGGYNPTITALYRDPEVIGINPFMVELYDTFVNAVARPSSVTGDRYNQVSNAFWTAVHQTLSGNGSAEQNLAQLERTLDRLSRGGRW